MLARVLCTLFVSIVVSVSVLVALRFWDTSESKRPLLVPEPKDSTKVSVCCLRGQTGWKELSTTAYSVPFFPSFMASDVHVYLAIKSCQKFSRVPYLLETAKLFDDKDELLLQMACMQICLL